MKTVTSKRHITRFYWNFLSSALFILLISSVCIYSFIRHCINSNALEGKLFLILLAGISALGFCCFYIPEYLKKVPNIRITPISISFNKKTFLIEDISHIRFSEKKDFIFSHSDCAMVVFKNNTAKLIFDDKYSNISEIKNALNLIVNNRCYKILPVKKEELSDERFNYHKGNLLLSHRMIMFSLIPLLFFFIMSTSKFNIIGFTTLIIYLIALFILVRLQFHFFGLSKNYLTVHNHLIPWKKEMYRIDDIELIRLESQGKSPNFIKIITKDYVVKKYEAATLNNKNWRTFKKALKVANIKIKDELYL